MENVQLFDAPYNPWDLLQAYEASQLKGQPQFGASSVFVGSMRDFNAGDDVTAMELEHYPGMTERLLRELIERARQQWPVQAALLAHRVGRIEPGEAIVLVAVWSPHRREAIRACQFLIEELKHNAPFWKKETLRDGSTRWVAENTPG